MKDIMALKDQLALIEKEIRMIAEELDAIRHSAGQTEDITVELKAIKVFLGRIHPEFKEQFPEIVKKVRRR